MNESLIAFASAEEWSLRLALTLLHFLWQGLAVGGMAVAVAWLLRHHSASARYRVYCVAFLALPICAATTFALLPIETTEDATTPIERQSVEADLTDSLRMASVEASSDSSTLGLDAENPAPNAGRIAVTSESIPGTPLVAIADVEPAVSQSDSVRQRSENESWLMSASPFITGLYGAGVLVLLLRLCLGVWGGQRLQTQAIPLTEPELLQRMNIDCRRLGLRRVPVVSTCERVLVPAVVGVLRPMILLPAAFVSGLDTETVAAILHHELAHIRRHDLLMNLLQRIVESLLFFHPVVWFLSRRISVEREICCDDVVLSAGYPPLHYAGALLQMAELCAASRPNVAALAATGRNPSQLEHRIWRLINGNEPAHLKPTRAGVLLCLVLIAAMGILPVLIRGVVEAQESNSPMATESPKDDNPKQEATSEKVPTEEEARAAFREASIHVSIDRNDGLRFGGEPSLHLDFSGTKVTDETMPYLLAFPEMTSLSFWESTQITDESLKIIGQLKNLESLHLSSSQITGTGLSHLAGCQRLRRLSIKSNKLRDSELKQLDQLVKLNLESLSIGGKQSSDEGLKHVGQFQSLQALRLHPGQTDQGESLVTGQTLKALAPLTNLKTLELMGDDIRQHMAITDQDLKVLENMPHLNSLTVSSRLLTNEGMEPIGQCRELTRVAIWHAPITDEALRPFAALNKLQSLQLYGTRVTGTGMKFLTPLLDDEQGDGGESRQKRLTHLSLIGVHATDQGLAEIGKFDSLSSLRIGPYGWFDKETKGPLPVTDNGLAHLVKLSNLSSLDLSWLSVSDLGLEKLQGCQRLSELALSKLPITDKGLTRLSQMPQLMSLELKDCNALKRADVESLHRAKPGLNIMVMKEGRQVGYLAGDTVRWDAPAKPAEQKAQDQQPPAADNEPAADVKDLLERMADQLKGPFGKPKLYTTDEAGEIVTLRLRDAKLKAGDAEIIGGLIQLKRLNLSSSNLAEADVRALQTLKELEDLNLFDTKIGDAALPHLRGLEKLQRLNIGDTKITDAGLTALKDLPTLKHLSLMRCAITDAGIKQLAGLKNLESLKVGETGITDQSLADLKSLPNLQGLTLDETQITPEGLKSLAMLPRFAWMESPRKTAEELARRMELGVFDTVEAMEAIGLELPRHGQFKLLKLETLPQNEKDKQLTRQRFRLEFDWVSPEHKINDLFFAVIGIDRGAVDIHEIGIVQPEN